MSPGLSVCARPIVTSWARAAGGSPSLRFAGTYLTASRTSSALWFSRGVPMEAARNLLTLSFLAEALAEIEDQALAEELQTRLEGLLARRA